MMAATLLGSKCHISAFCQHSSSNDEDLSNSYIYSSSACLTRSDEYQGGGTYIRAIRKTIRLEQGQVLVHPGELYHKGCDITGGIRLLIVCFMDGYDPKIADPSSEKTDSVEYEKNVRSY